MSGVQARVLGKRVWGQNYPPASAAVVVIGTDWECNYRHIPTCVLAEEKQKCSDRNVHR